MERKECSVKCEVWRKQWEVRSVKCGVWSVKCGVWSLSLECEERSVKCEVWSVRFGVWRKQWEVRSVECEVWSVECEVWSLECEECSVQCEVWSVEGRTRSGQVVFELYTFMFGKLPPPACPGLCYISIFLDIIWQPDATLENSEVPQFPFEKNHGFSPWTLAFHMKHLDLLQEMARKVALVPMPQAFCDRMNPMIRCPLLSLLLITLSWGCPPQKKNSAICRRQNQKKSFFGVTYSFSWIFSCRHRIHRCSPTTLRHV